MSGGCKLRIAAPPAASARYDEALVSAAEVVQLFAALLVVKDRSHGHLQRDVCAVTSGLVRSLTVSPALRFVFGIESKMHQGVVALAGFHDDIAAATAIATGRAATRHKLLPAERDAAVAAVAGLNTNPCLINEHVFS